MELKQITDLISTIASETMETENNIKEEEIVDIRKVQQIEKNILHALKEVAITVK